MELNHLVKLVTLIGDFQSTTTGQLAASQIGMERNVGNESGSSYQNNLGKGIDKKDGIVHEIFRGINPPRR